MKLIKQIKLFFQQGASNKVYEVDLCEVGDDQYVVNFRYGRIGANLKEGTKTVFPVNLGEAEKTYANLVSSKTKKGYTETYTDSPRDVSVANESAEISPLMTLKSHAVLKRLEAACEGKLDKAWSLSRVIWRAGELALSEAEPSILKLFNHKDRILCYCSIWALGRLGARNSFAMIESLLNGGALSEANERIAREAYYALASEEDKKKSIDSFFCSLPESLQQGIKNNDSEALKATLIEMHEKLKTSSNEHLYQLYFLSQEYSFVLTILHDILLSIPLKPNYFKFFRYIFKMAEFRGDVKTYAICSYRLDREKAYFNQPNWGHVYIDNNYVKFSQEVKKSTSRLAYSNKTKAYFNRRIMTSLNKLGELGVDDYAELAANILTQYSDKHDASDPFSNTIYRYDPQTYRSSTELVHYDSYCKNLVFNQILYQNSPRYEICKSSGLWRCRNNYEPGQSGPKEREEAYPEIWEKNPMQLISVMKLSEAHKVQEFAIKAFYAVNDYPNYIDLSLVEALLAKTFHICHEFAVECAKQIFKPEESNERLLELLIECQSEEGRALARKWIEEQSEIYLSSINIVSAMLTTAFQDNLVWAKETLARIQFEEDKAQLIVAKTISIYMNFDETPETFPDLSDFFVELFVKELSSISILVIQDLFAHVNPALQMLGGKLLLNHSIKVEELPEEFLATLFNASTPEARKVGLELLGKLSTSHLLAKKDLLFNFCLSELEDVRSNVTPVVSKLAQASPEFAEETVGLFTPALLKKENFEGVHEYLSRLLQTELKDHLSSIRESMVWALLKSSYSEANKLGCYMLLNHFDSNSIEMTRLTELGSHEIHAVRQFVRKYFENHLDFVREHKMMAVKLFDSTWEDTRVFSFDYFKSRFTKQDWTPELLVRVCDSTRDEVQTYGRNLINQYFEDCDGQDYLLQLSQHPSMNLQLFASNYLERFAKENREVIQTLNHFFVTVLSLVNKGSVTKQRVIHFLRSEALKEKEIAKAVLEIFNRQILTISIQEKALYIEALYEIRETFPDLESALNIVETPVYTRSEI